MAAVKQILCNVGEQVYGIGLIHVRGIEKYTDIIHVPNAPSFIEGIINLRGDVIPVFNLHNKFGLEKTQRTENTKLIIVKSRDMLIAFMVDEVSEIVEIDDSEFHPIPKVVECEETSYIESVIQVKERLIVILNLDGILTEIEQKKLQNLIEEHQ